jgi:hypothetical protein
VCLPLWERRAGLRADLPPWVPREAPSATDAELVRRILMRLDEFAAQWHELPVGEGITLTWTLPRARGARHSKHRAAAR